MDKKNNARDWLNEDEGLTAFVSTTTNEQENADGSIWYWSGLVIADCNRKVTIDFSPDSPEDVLKLREKVKVLRKHLNIIDSFLDSIDLEKIK